MNELPISMEEFHEILLQEQKEYDIARIVNPYACGTMKLDGDKISAEVICNRASMALRHVKDCGDSMACAVYTEQMTLAALSDNRLVSQFEQALKKDELQNTDR